MGFCEQQLAGASLIIFQVCTAALNLLNMFKAIHEILHVFALDSFIYVPHPQRIQDSRVEIFYGILPISLQFMKAFANPELCLCFPINPEL